jgi:hypothetical protein
MPFSFRSQGHQSSSKSCSRTQTKRMINKFWILRLCGNTDYAGYNSCCNEVPSGLYQTTGGGQYQHGSPTMVIEKAIPVSMAYRIALPAYRYVTVFSGTKKQCLMPSAGYTISSAPELHAHVAFRLTVLMIHSIAYFKDFPFRLDA